MERKKDGTIEIDLLHLLQVFWKKAWVIGLAAFLCGVLGFGYSTFCLKPLYQSKVMVYVNNHHISLDTHSVSISSGDLSASKSLVDTYIVILKTRRTLNEVIRRAGLSKTYEELSAMIGAEALNGTEIFTITVTSPNPYEAKAIVNTVADVLPEKIAEVVEGTAGKIVDYGVVNTNKVSPVRTKYTAIGLVIGAVLACGVLTVLDLMNDLIRDESYLERYEFPVLAVIPDLAENEKGTEIAVCEKLPFLAEEAYKLLRTNLMFVLPEKQKCRIVGVTSSFRSEGKSTTSLNLAWTLSRTDKSVLFIEGDMRLPSLSKKLTEIKETPGLSNILAGLCTAEEAIRHGVRSANWDILPAGDLPPNPAELLGSEKMRELLEQFSRIYDWIVVDLPPADIVSDALALTGSLSGIMVVVRHNYTDKQSLKDCMNKLELVKANVAGFAVTDAEAEQHAYGRYGRYGRKNRYSSYHKKSYSYKNYYTGGYGTSKKSSAVKGTEDNEKKVSNT